MIWTSTVESKDALERRFEAETGSLFFLTYCGSLRGFEISKIVLSDLKKQTLSPKESQKIYKLWESGATLCFVSLPRLFLSKTTINAKANHRYCMGNALRITACNLDLKIDQCFGGLLVANVWAHQREGRQMRMYELSEYFFELLLEIQKY